MSMHDLVQQLRALNVRLWVDAGSLRFRAPPGVVTDALRAQIAAHQPELLSWLRRASGAEAGGEIVHVSRDGALPLSFAQQRLWVVEQLSPGIAAYNMPMAVRLEGELDREALGRSLDEIVSRHEALRTRFVVVEGQARQVIDENAAVDLPLVDLRTWEAQARERELSRLGRDWPLASFDLSTGPLLRAQLIRVAEREHLLLLAIHHIVSDGWTLGILLRELEALYGAFSRGEASPLAPLPVQYADFAHWQRSWLSGAVLDEHLGYWKERLAGLPAMELATNRRRPQVRTYAGAVAAVKLPARLARDLGALSRGEGATLFMTLLSAFFVLLQRYSAQDDLVVGSPIANRAREELEGLIGFFANMLVLRADLSGEPTFRELLAQVKQTALRAYEHQDLPFERLVEELDPERDASRNPLFQVSFALQNAPGDDPVPEGIAPRHEPASLRFRLVPSEVTTSRFDLEVFARDTGEGLDVAIVYASDLFDAATIRRMLGHYERLLEEVVKHPERRVCELPLLDEAERRQVVEEWNATGADYPAKATIHGLFEAQAARTPEAVALEYEGEELSYGELDARANQVARYLVRHGVGPETMVGLCVERGVEMVVATLGILKAGGAYVPLDPEYPASRLAFMLGDTAAPVLLTQAKLSGRLPECSGRVVCLDADWAEIAREERGAPEVKVGARNLAYVIYTSGSTGTPKGTCIEHRSVVRLVKNTNYIEVGPDEVFLQFAPISFDASTLELWGPLLNGGKLVVCPAGRVSLEELGRVIRERGVTTLWLTSALFNQMVDTEIESLRGVRQLLAGGEALSAPHVRRMLEVIGERRLVNGYGPTENTTFTCCHVMRAGTRIGNTVPIGRPIANTRVYVLDARMQPVPVGVPGELYAGGDGLAREYLHQPELTAEKFVPDPFDATPGARLYRTGDLVRWLPGGDIEFLGRIDQQVKLRGYRIELGEVEAALVQHPAVRQAVAMLREDEPGDKRLVAYVVAEDGAPADLVAQLRAQLRAQLPGHMIPAATVLLDVLPLSPNGKVDRGALPAPERSSPEATYVAPRTPTEEVVAGIWAEVLRLDRVGVHDNFFEMGGHSLKLIQLHQRIHAVLDTDLAVVELFEFPTIATLARRLRGDVPETTLLADARDRMAGRFASAGEDAIAIVGLAGRFPGAADIAALWSNLKAGVESIRRFTREELLNANFPSHVLDEPDFVPAMGWLEDTDRFDAGFFGYSPREAELIDPQHRLFLEYAWAALESAGHAPGEFDGLIGVFGGTGRNAYRENIDSHPDLVATAGLQTVLGGERDFLTTRVSYKLGLGGPSVNVQTACSTSLVAVHMACRSLRGRECDMALAGGVAVAVPTEGGYTYHQDGIGSPDGHCRTFDKSAKGTVAGSGVALVVLRRLSDALEDGDTIHAVIRGTAINNDGAAKVGFTAPGVDGQSRVIAMALADAGVDAETIGYVEAHGTATTLGDPIEVAALTRAYGPRKSGKARCGLGSLKSNLGHLDAAAGVASLIKATLCLSHGELVPSLHYRVPNPEIDFDKGPFFVTTENRAWARPADHPRRAAVSSFGIGGTNAHVILEEAPAPERTPAPGRPWRVLTLSALTTESLKQAAARLAEHLDAQPEVDLDDVAYTLQVGRRSFRHRRVVLARTRNDAVRALTTPGDAHSWSSSAKPNGAKVAFMFPGQGAQYTGMARELYDHEAVFRATVDEVAEFMRDAIGCHLGEILYPAAGVAAGDELTSRTLVTQSALFAVELGLARLWMSWGIKPVACIGHSIGEYVAACVSGAVSLDGVLRLLKARGQLMADAPKGAMLAVAMEEKALLRRLGAGLWLSAVNGPASCVVSGVPERVDVLETELRAEAVECRRLRTAGAFHSGLMDSVIAPLEEVAHRVAIAAPLIPYVSNVTGDWVSASDLEPGYWGRHVREAVRFDDGVVRVLELGATVLLEVGPGNTLSTLARQRLRANGEADVTVLSSLRHARQEVEDGATVGEALGRLWSAGVAPDWSAYHAGADRKRVPLPTYRFSKDRYWIDRAPANAPARSTPVQGKGELGNWFHVPTWRQRTPRAPESAGPAHAPGSWVVLMDSAGVGEEIASTLEARGRHTIRVRVGHAFRKTGARDYEVDPRNPQDIGALLDALDGEKPALARVVHAWCLAKDATDEGAFDRGFYSLLYLLQRLNRVGDDPVGVTVVTNRVYSLCGEEAWHPERAAVVALCRIGPQSIPGLWCSSIDLDGTPARGRAWIQEVVRSIEAPAAQIAAFRGGREFLRVMEPRPLPAIEAGPGRLREGGRYLITGGLGNVGLALARHLAKRVRAKLVLVGRRSAQAASGGDGASPDPAPALAAIRKLEELGADVLTVQADVSDVTQLREAFAKADERFGGIDGVIHAAGVTSGQSFRALGEITRADLETQFVPKWYGVRALHDALGERRLDFCLLTSSLSVELGGLKFAAYAAANAIMDQLSEQYRRVDGSRWISVGWDGWDFEPGQSDSGGAGWPGLTPREGGEAFDRILAAEDVSTVTVCTGDFQARLVGSTPGRGGHGGVEATHERPALDTQFVAPRDEQERVIAEAWQKVLGLERIGVFDDFFDLGGDSLIAVQLMGRLRASLGVEVGVQALFDAPTVAALSERLGKTGKVASQDAAEIASLQDMISRMSDEEVRAALAGDVKADTLDRVPDA